MRTRSQRYTTSRTAFIAHESRMWSKIHGLLHLFRLCRTSVCICGNLIPNIFVELCKLSTDDGSVLPDSTQELKVRDGIVVERVT